MDIRKLTEQNDTRRMHEGENNVSEKMVCGRGAGVPRTKRGGARIHNARSVRDAKEDEHRFKRLRADTKCHLKRISVPQVQARRSRWAVLRFCGSGLPRGSRDPVRDIQCSVFVEGVTGESFLAWASDNRRHWIVGMLRTLVREVPDPIERWIAKSDDHGTQLVIHTREWKANVISSELLRAALVLLVQPDDQFCRADLVGLQSLDPRGNGGETAT